LKSLPLKLLEELHSIKSFDELSFIAAHELQPVTSVRINPAKNIHLFGANEKVPWCASGVYLKDRPIFTLDPAYHAGAYYVQEASSMFLDHMLRSILQDKQGLRVLDLCAAPGGKSTLIASLIDKNSLLISNDVIRTRASILEENMTRWGYINTWVASNDPRDFGKLAGYFDVIVVDAPCSGSGLFRKDVRALDEWSEGNVHLCSERQQRILADVWPALKQDGILVYATCSYSVEEDEQILDWLGNTFDVQTIDVPINEEWGIVSVSSPEKGMTGFRFFPDKVNGEGFFIAALQKNEEANTLRPAKFKTAHDKKIEQQAGWLLNDTDALIIQTEQNNFCTINKYHEADRELMKKIVYLRKTGLQLGTPAGKDWVPDHQVALSIDASSSLPFLNVDKDNALRFLKREDMGISDLEKGWMLVKYNGLGLGWIKSLGNRINNYLPKHWRIRMKITDEE